MSWSKYWLNISVRPLMGANLLFLSQVFVSSCCSKVNSIDVFFNFFVESVKGLS